MTRQQFGERAFDVGKGKYWPNFFTETFAMKKRLLIKVETTFPKNYLDEVRQRITAVFFFFFFFAQQTGYRQEPDRYSSC